MKYQHYAQCLRFDALKLEVPCIARPSGDKWVRDISSVYISDLLNLDDTKNKFKFLKNAKTVRITEVFCYIHSAKRLEVRSKKKHL